MQQELHSVNIPEGLQQRKLVVRNGECENASSDQVAEETPVAIVYNGVTHAVMMASPIDLEDFALGFSFTEGLIDSLDDFQSMQTHHAAQGIALQISVPQKCAERLKARQRSLAGRAGCGICGLTDIAAAVPALAALTPRPAPDYAAVSAAANALQSAQQLQQACGGIHGAALCNSAGNVLLVREDVGRHNALDKLIGAAFRRQRGPAIADDDFILMSSRASHELINKCVLAGVGTLVTLSAATSLAIDIAAQSKLNLIGFLRGDRQLVYYANQ